MVGISTHLIISVCTWCVSVRISSWCVILHIMYSKTVQPQSHQKTCTLFLLFTTIGVLLQYNTAPRNYAYCTDTHHVFQSWCVSVRISSYQYAHGAYQYASCPGVKYFICTVKQYNYKATKKPCALFLLFTTI